MWSRPGSGGSAGLAAGLLGTSTSMGRFLGLSVSLPVMQRPWGEMSPCPTQAVRELTVDDGSHTATLEVTDSRRDPVVATFDYDVEPGPS
jgi:hypothetical protein